MAHGTKSKIADAFKELVCKKSFSKITISDIARECNMTRENFYYHFRDKFDIIRWIFEVDLLNPESCEEDFLLWMRCMMHFISEERVFYSKIVREVGKYTVYENIYPAMEKRLFAVVEGSLDESVWNMRKEKVRFITSFFTSAFVELLIKSIIENEIIDYESYVCNLEFLVNNYLPFVRNPKESI